MTRNKHQEVAANFEYCFKIQSGKIKANQYMILNGNIGFIP